MQLVTLIVSWCFLEHVYRVYVCCSGLALEKGPAVHQALSSVISEALVHAPSIVILDDLDSIVSSNSASDGSPSSTSVTAVTKFLVDMIDEFEVIVLS